MKSFLCVTAVLIAGNLMAGPEGQPSLVPPRIPRVPQQDLPPLDVEIKSDRVPALKQGLNVGMVLQFQNGTTGDMLQVQVTKVQGSLVFISSINPGESESFFQNLRVGDNIVIGSAQGRTLINSPIIGLQQSEKNDIRVGNFRFRFVNNNN